MTLITKKVRALTAWEAEDEVQFSMACEEYPLFNNQSQNLEKCGHLRRVGYLLLVHFVYSERAMKISWGGGLSKKKTSLICLQCDQFLTCCNYNLIYYS